MTRRQALLLSLSGSAIAQVSGPAPASQGTTQIQPHPGAAHPQEALVRWNPDPVFNGAPVLFKSRSFSGPGDWLGKMIQFRPDGDAFSALPA